MLKTIKLYKGKEELKFDTEKHRYWNKEGEYLLSVTAATGVIDKSAPLMYWAVNLSRDFLLDKIKNGVITNQLIEEASKQHRIFKKKAANIGTQIHEWVSAWILGKKPPMPKNEKVVNGITAFLKFQKEKKVKLIESERLVYSKKYKFAGTLDAIGELGNKLLLIDFKSSKAIYDEMILQTSGYQIAYEEEIKKIDGRMILKFGKEDGEFEVRTINPRDDDKDKKAFLACLSIKRRLGELSKK